MDAIQTIAQKLVGKAGGTNQPVADGSVAAIFKALLNKDGDAGFDAVASLESSSGFLSGEESNDYVANETDVDSESSDDKPEEPEAKADDNADDSDEDTDTSNEEDGSEDQDASASDEDNEGAGEEASADAAQDADGAADAAVGAAQAQVLKEVATDGTETGDEALAAAIQAAGAQQQGQQQSNNGQNNAAVQAAASAGQNANDQARQAFQAAAGQQTAADVDGEDGLTQTQTAQTAVKSQAQGQANAQTNGQANQQQNAAAQQQAKDLANKVGEDAKLRVQVTVTDESSKQLNKNSALLASASRIALEGPENVRNQIAASSFNNWNSYQGPNAQGQAVANGGQGVGQAAPQAQPQQPVTPVEQSSNQAPTPTPSPSAPLSQSPTAQQGNPRVGLETAERSASLSTSSSSASASASASSSATTQTTTTNTAPQPASAPTSTTNGQSQFAQQVQTTTQGAERTQTQGTQVIDQIRVAVTKGAKQGLDRVQIQLKPAELGRVDVRLEMNAENQVRVTVTAESRDTLDLMQRDSRGLEKALQDAGLRTDSDDIEFELREEDGTQLADKQDGNGEQGGNEDGDSANDNDALLEEENYDYAAAAEARGGVDTHA